MNVKGRDMKENFTMKYVIEQSDKNGYDIIEKEMIKSKLIYEDSQISKKIEKFRQSVISPRA